jgi:hypothetical protein
MKYLLMITKQKELQIYVKKMIIELFVKNNMDKNNFIQVLRRIKKFLIKNVVGRCLNNKN